MLATACTSCGAPVVAGGFCLACGRLVAEKYLATHPRTRAEPTDWDTHFDLGVAFEQMGLYEDSLYELLTAVQRSGAEGGDAWAHACALAETRFAPAWDRALEEVRRARRTPS